MKTSARAALSAAVLALLGAAAAPPAGAAPNTYLTLSDGTRLAANVQLPEGEPPEGGWPAVFTYDGYAGGSSELSVPASMRNRFARMKVSIRGTGCSGGQFRLFDRRHARDGAEIVDWIAGRPWSNGRVGIIGHSYGGLTAMFTAAERPQHLDTVVASGLIDDLYRGLVYPGGVPNLGFPLVWPYVYRPAVDVATGTAPGAGDPECLANLATRQVPDLADEPLLNGVLGHTDGPWWLEHSLRRNVHEIDIPAFVGHAWQDEQTGPRGGPLVFELLPDTIEKRLVAANGDHGTNGGAVGDVRDQRWAWIRRFVDDEPNGIEDRPPVQVLLENAGGTPGGSIESSDFPLPDTQWRRYHLRSGGRLTTAAPGALEGSTSYVSATGRQSWNYFAPAVGGEITAASGPDEAAFRSDPMAAATTIAGPIAASLQVSTTALGLRLPITAIDTDVFVEVLDQAPDGALTYLQRGMLRASFRALDGQRSLRNADGEVVRPEHPFTNPQAVRPGEVMRMDVEVFPVAHVFRPGHRIVVKFYAPPFMDSLYVYVPNRIPGLTTLHHSAGRRSSLLLPVVPTPALSGGAPACGQLVGMRCVRPAG